MEIIKKVLILILLVLIVLLLLSRCLDAATNINTENQKATMILVDKSERKLFLFRKGKMIGEYKITAFGAYPEGPKHQVGDEKTPEGLYLIDYKNRNSQYHKSMHISYPAPRDMDFAEKAGVDPGGGITIHGIDSSDIYLVRLAKYSYKWTDGCIAVSNEDMDKIWAAVDKWTPIRIEP